MAIYTVERLHSDNTRRLIMASESPEDSVRLAIMEASGFDTSKVLLSAWADGKVQAVVEYRSTGEDICSDGIEGPAELVKFISGSAVKGCSEAFGFEQKMRVYSALTKEQKKYLKDVLKDFNSKLWLVEPTVEEFGVSWSHSELDRLCN